MRHPVTFLLVTALLANLATGCSAGMIATGGGLIVAGGYTLAKPEEHCDSNTGDLSDDLGCGLWDEPVIEFGNAMDDAVGTTLLVGGVVMVIAGLVMHNRETQADQQSDRSPPAYMVTTNRPVTTNPPGFETVSVPVSEEASGATMAIRAKVENRLAIQASTMAARGNCVGVLPTMQRLAEIDPDMHRQLMVSDAAIAGCYTRSELNAPGFFTK